MKLSRFLISLAGLMVPSANRAEWSREWLAELDHARLRGLDSSGLIRFARGAFLDALWYSRGAWNRDALAMKSQSGSFCLAGLAALIVLIAVVSGFLPITRSVVTPLPYREPERIATASLGGAALATRFAVRAGSVELWQGQSELLEGAAAYSLKKDGVTRSSSGREERVTTVRVSDNFFSLLGARASDGRAFERDQLARCEDCVILSYSFWQRALNGKPLTLETSVFLNGRPYRVAGVTEKRFWFLSRDISIWPVVALSSFGSERTGVVVRLGPDVAVPDAERELSASLLKAGAIGWDSLVRISPLSDRVREVFGSFGLALGLAIVTAAASSRVRLPRWSLRAALFFLLKTALLLVAVLLAGLEFTHASLITMLGGADALTEPLSTWLFLLGCMGALLWSVYDQQARCRVCLRRLGLPTRVGCPGCLLLDWSGTELVCVAGHGILHVPEMVACWQEPEHWTSLDDSWQGLFERS